MDADATRAEGTPTRPRRVARLLTGSPGATLLYTAVALALTWPLAPAITRSLPLDMGDPVLNTWILARSADHLWRFVTGDLHAFAGYWHAGIFHPAPLALAYSEHLFAQALQVLPVWAATKNAILTYNVAFLSTFVLSGLGAYLFVRDLTGSRGAALAAGLFYGFAPYRIGQYSHLQVLSSQWMPFVLLAIRRHVTTGSWTSLAGLCAAAVAQNLSCGYFLVYFPPFAAACAALEITARRRWRDAALLGRLALAAVVIAACTWPFLQPYMELRGLGFEPRSLAEVIGFSADVRGYASAHESQWLWGTRMEAFRKAEGVLFPGFAVTVLVLAAMTAALVQASTSGVDGERGWQYWVAAAAVGVASISLVAALVVLVAGGQSGRLLGLSLRASSLPRHLWRAFVALLVALALSTRARRVAGELVRSPEAWFFALALAAGVLSLGPEIRSGGRMVAPTAPYAYLHVNVPGFDGLRVPARFAMVAVLFLSALAGLGVAALERRGRFGRTAALLLTLLFVAESGAAPLPLDARTPADGLAVPPRSLFAHDHVPPAYRYLRTLPEDAVVAEFPFGSETYEVRYMYAALAHGRRLVNGYSGGFPRGYIVNAALLRDVGLRPDAAWAALVASGATHALVHRSAFLNGSDAVVVEWLEARGARKLATFGTDVIYDLR